MEPTRRGLLWRRTAEELGEGLTGGVHGKKAGARRWLRNLSPLSVCTRHRPSAPDVQRSDGTSGVVLWNQPTGTVLARMGPEIR